MIEGADANGVRANADMDKPLGISIDFSAIFLLKNMCKKTIYEFLLYLKKVNFLTKI